MATKEVAKNYRIQVQKAAIIVSDNYDIFPDCISNEGRRVIIQIPKA